MLQVHVMVELVCLAAIGIMLGIKCKWLGWKATIRRPAMVFQIVIMLGMFIEAGDNSASLPFLMGAASYQSTHPQ